MLLRSTAPHINKYSLKPYTERKKTKKKKTQNVPNQNSIGSASRRESTERRKTKKNLCCVFRGPLYRSTGQNINCPNINELQISCSKGQQKPVDV